MLRSIAPCAAAVVLAAAPAGAATLIQSQTFVAGVAVAQVRVLQTSPATPAAPGFVANATSNFMVDSEIATADAGMVFNTATEATSLSASLSRGPALTALARSRSTVGLQATNGGPGAIDLFLDLDLQGLNLQTTGYAGLPQVASTAFAELELFDANSLSVLARIRLDVGGAQTASTLTVDCSLVTLTSVHRCASGPQVASIYLQQLAAGALAMRRYAWELRVTDTENYRTNRSMTAQLDRAKLRFRGVDVAPPPPPPPAPGVPEPATWALMIAGFGLAGSALRRRRAAA